MKADITLPDSSPRQRRGRSDRPWTAESPGRDFRFVGLGNQGRSIGSENGSQAIEQCGRLSVIRHPPPLVPQRGDELPFFLGIVVAIANASVENGAFGGDVLRHKGRIGAQPVSKIDQLDQMVSSVRHDMDVQQSTSRPRARWPRSASAASPGTGRDSAAARIPSAKSASLIAARWVSSRIGDDEIEVPLPAQPGTELLPTCSTAVSGNRSAINATTRAATSGARGFHGRNAGGDDGDG